MFIQVPIYTASLESEEQIQNTDLIERVKPHANVPVDPGAVSTTCCEIFFAGGSDIVLVPYAEMYSRLNTVIGITDVTGEAL